MSQYHTRKKALNRKRDEMMDLFVDSKIKLANKPIIYGNFYDHVIDLDRPLPKAKRLSAQATKQAKPLASAPRKTATPPTLDQHAKPVNTQTKTVEKTAEQTQATSKQTGSNRWDRYTK